MIESLFHIFLKVAFLLDEDVLLNSIFQKLKAVRSKQTELSGTYCQIAKQNTAVTMTPINQVLNNVVCNVMENDGQNCVPHNT